VNQLAQLLVLLLQAALDVQQVIGFLLQLLLGGSQDVELLVLGFEVVQSQATLLGLLLDLQRQVLHLRERRQRRRRKNTLHKVFLDNLPKISEAEFTFLSILDTKVEGFVSESDI